MAERRDEERLHKLLDEIDGRLRDAERLRSHAEDRRRRAPFYPDRRRRERVPTIDRPKDPDRE